MEVYSGKMTKKLEQLYLKYKAKWGHTPDFYENAEYGANDYFDFVFDIEKSLKIGVELPNIYPHDDEF